MCLVQGSDRGSVSVCVLIKILPVGNKLRDTAIHKRKPFNAGLIKFITSSPVLALVVEGRFIQARAHSTNAHALCLVLELLISVGVQQEYVLIDERARR